MPFCYDTNYAINTGGSAGTEVSQLWAHTINNQETVSLLGVYVAAQFGTAGGAQLRVKTNTGTIASGGSGVVPTPKNLRGSVAAQSLWYNATTAISAGATLTKRLTIGFAQTGGMGGYVPITPQDAIQLMSNAVNPVDLEFTSIANGTSVLADLSIDMGEGV